MWPRAGQEEALINSKVTLGGRAGESLLHTSDFSSNTLRCAGYL